MSQEEFRIPKKLKQVVLWAHPEGRVIGSLFVREQSLLFAGEERPSEVLNEERPFIVLKLDEPGGIRFYNRASIVRVEYLDPDRRHTSDSKLLSFGLQLMDGSIFEGTIRRPLPPSHSRMFDYLNTREERFMELEVEPGEYVLINKQYILYAVAKDEE